PLYSLQLFQLAEDGACCLGLLLHHLIADPRSCQIYLDELLEYYQRLVADPDGAAPPASATPFRYWAEREARASSHEPDDGRVSAQRAWWSRQPWNRASTLPADRPVTSTDRGSAQSIVAALTEDETIALRDEALAAFRVTLEELILCALAIALANRTGANTVTITTHSDARDEFSDIDLSRSLGLYTLPCLHLCEVPSGSLGDQINALKEQLRQTQQHRLSYATWIQGDVPAHVIHLGQIHFQYRDAIELPDKIDGTPWQLISWQRRTPRDGTRPGLLELDCTEVATRLTVTLIYSQQAHEHTTAQALSDALLSTLRDMIDHSRDSQISAVPSDFPLAEMDASELSVLAALIEQSESSD
ncbi:MAG: condensation domain-containing protein, partial [Myxococcota bacterium]